MFFKESKQLAAKHRELRDVFRGLDELIRNTGKHAVLQAASIASLLGHDLWRVDAALDLLAEAGVLSTTEMLSCGRCATLNRDIGVGATCSQCGESLAEDAQVRQVYRPTRTIVERLTAVETGSGRGTRRRGMSLADVLIVTAVKDEYLAVLSVDTGAVPRSHWARRTGATKLEVAFRDFVVDGGIIRVAVTQALGMGGVNAVTASQQLIKDYRVRCLSMCGVCAGRRGEVELGDVIVANRLWQYDTGKYKVEVDTEGARRIRDQGDIDMYRIAPPEWIHAAERFQVEVGAAWLALRPRSYEAQGDWILERVFHHADPATDPQQGTWCVDYDKALARLWKQRLLKDGTLELTDVGSAHVSRILTLNRNKLPEPKAFRVHVGPVASGNKLMEDAEIFSLLAGSVRKVLGVEMEAAAIGTLAYASELRYSVVMKAVMDHADTDKNDNFKVFAARASAECLVAFLRKNLPPRP